MSRPWIGHRRIGANLLFFLRPHRLVAKDACLSGRRRRFEFSWGHHCAIGQIAILLACALAYAYVAPGAAAAVPASVIAGADRYQTAAAVSRASFPTASVVILASGASWPDALGGSALSGAAHGPLLLSSPASLSAAAASELARIRPARVYVLGGERALSSRVENRVGALLPGADIVRLGGSNRYAVASRIAEEVERISGHAPERVFVVTGAGFADALSCASPAAARAWPILLADPRRPAATAAAVRATGATGTVIIGGRASVSSATERAIASALGGSGRVRRIGGSDRYTVSAAVASYAEKELGLTFARPVFASGAGFGDALAGGSLAARYGAPLLLLDPKSLPDPIARALFARHSGVESLTFLGGSLSVPPHVRTSTQHALRARSFSAGNATDHVRTIAAMGPRGAGGSAERRAADYFASRLRASGYTVSFQSVRLPGGRTSRNVIAERPGTAPEVIVIGGHLDSKPPSPGANDNASGVAVTLELARCLADAEGLVPTIRFIGFAAEEISGPSSDDHHFGARQYVASLSSAQRAKIQTMIAIDMVGTGSTFNVRTMRLAPLTTVRSLQSWGRYTGQAVPFLKDPGRFGWSDHEAFEHVGIPVAWLEWREDPNYHTVRDTASRVSADRVRRTGRLMRGWLLDLTPRELAALRP